MTSLLASAFSSGWASGVNSYAVVLVLGLLGRYADAAHVPHALERTDVLVVAGVLYAVEFVVDKIPYVDSLWDSVSTAIRPTVGTVVGLLLAGKASTPEQAFSAATGGVTALASHLTKAGLRLGVNTSPEPVTNIAVSVVEDVSVAGVVTLAVVSPWAAATVAAVLLAAGITLVWVLWARVRRSWARMRVWMQRHGLAAAAPEAPAAP